MSANTDADSQAEGRRFESGIPLRSYEGRGFEREDGRALLGPQGNLATPSNLVNDSFEPRELDVALVDEASILVAQQQIVFAGPSDDIEPTRP